MQIIFDSEEQKKEFLDDTRYVDLCTKYLISGVKCALFDDCDACWEHYIKMSVKESED